MLTQSALDSAREAAIRAWEGVAAANAESKALQSQIDASALALEGVRVEMSYGTRTTLDLLDAQQEYLTAQVSYVAAEANRIVASYSLLAAIGRLTAQDLKLNVPIYDPVKNFQNVKGRTFNAPFHGDQR
jgi:outer membrane protein